ncbi:DNA primase [Bacteroidota bacterium]
MRIPEIKIEEIRSSVSIVDVLSAYVQLKKRGKNYVGLCPFHQEKTPSFTVSEEKQIFHCFGCHAGGNVFKFLMDYKNVSFVEAVQEVAEQAGISIEYEKGYDAEKQDELEVYYDINTQAAKYFSANLLQSDPAEHARNYLTNRNISLQTQRSFGMGYAMPEWDHFLKYAEDKKIDLSLAKTLGLIDTRDDGEYYDKYRDRIIFPIFSPNGRVIAFGGRILNDKEKTAKYLNSPESAIYQKRKSLYGLYHSKEEIRKLDKAILVEGYMDLIALFQHGVKNVVASSGTSLTDEQVQLLSRFTRNIIVLFDADTAGQKAAMRSIEILLNQNFEIRVISLPKGEDPDSYINEHGKENFEELVAKAQNFLEYQAAVFQETGMFEDPAKQTEAIREIIRMIALVSDELKRNILLKTISNKFGLREKLLESELERFLNQAAAKERRTEAVKEQRERAAANHNKHDNDVKRKESPFEKELIRLLYGGNEKVIEYILENISPAEFVNPIYKQLAQIVSDALNDNIYSPAVLVEKIEDEKLKTSFIAFLMAGDQISKKWDKVHYNGKIEKDTYEYAVATVKNYRVYKIDEKIKENNIRISELTDDKDVEDLMVENNELMLKKKTLLQEE